MDAGGWMLFVLWMAGCGADPLTAMGLAPEIPAEPAPVDGTEVPTTPPVSGEDIADGGVKEHDDGAAPSAAPPPPKFDPISVPLGPRETSVKWDGVSRKGEGRAVDFGNGEKGDPSLGRGMEE